MEVAKRAGGPGFVTAHPAALAARHNRGQLVLTEPWFASGVLFAKAKSQNSELLFALACLLGLAAAVLVFPFLSELRWDDRYAMIAMLVLFATSQRSAFLQQAIGRGPLLLIGIVSYPLYLIHETIGLGLIVLTKRMMPQISNVMIPVPTFVLMLAVSYWITKHAEPRLRVFLERRLTRKAVTVSAAT